jgi:hypothetical protein
LPHGHGLVVIIMRLGAVERVPRRRHDQRDIIA